MLLRELDVKDPYAISHIPLFPSRSQQGRPTEAAGILILMDKEKAKWKTTEVLEAEEATCAEA